MTDIFGDMNSRAVSPYLPKQVQATIKAAIADRICAAAAAGDTVLVTIESEDGEMASNLAEFTRCLEEHWFQGAKDAEDFVAGVNNWLAVVYDAGMYISVTIKGGK